MPSDLNHPSTPAEVMRHVAMLAELSGAVAEGFAAEVGAHQLDVERARSELADRREAAALDSTARAGELAPIAARRRGDHQLSRNAQARVCEELQRQIAELGGKVLSEIPRIPGFDWRIRSECRGIIIDGSGKKAIKYLCSLPSRIRSIVLRCVREVGGFRRVVGRRIVQCAWATWRLARNVLPRLDRHGALRPGRTPWAGGLVVDGYARGVWRLLCVDGYGQAVSLGTLWGTHNGRSHTLGPMARLRRAGAWTRIQPPAGVARYVGPTGWAVGQMWFGRYLSGRTPYSADEDLQHGAELAELLALIGPAP